MIMVALEEAGVEKCREVDIRIIGWYQGISKFI
jgi:hypothetical protein